MATSPGHAGRPNEDFVGAVPGAVVLLDGAGIPGTESICHHGVAWYAHTLGAAVLGRLSRDPATELDTALADSIEQLAGQHRHTCDIADPSSPQATVAIVRFGVDHLDYLLLADSFVVVESAESGTQVLTDPREVEVRAECTTPLRGLTPGTPAYERELASVIDAFRARRNQPGGYWIAKDDPEAAARAVTGSVPLDQLSGVALLSNGASRIVDPYRLADWPEALGLIRTNGPDEILRQVRKADRQTDREPDDATVAYCEP